MMRKKKIQLKMKDGPKEELSKTAREELPTSGFVFLLKCICFAF